MKGNRPGSCSGAGAFLPKQAAALAISMPDPLPSCRYITGDNSAYCESRLARDPLTRARLAAAWQWMEAWAPVLAPAGAGAAPLGKLLGEHMGCRLCISQQARVHSRNAAVDRTHTISSRGPQPAGCSGEAAADCARCVGVLTWHQCVLGVLLPVLTAGFTAPAMPAAADEDRPQGRPQPAGRVKAAMGAAGRGLAVIGGTLRRVDAALQACCRCSPLPVAQLALACLMLASNFWGLARNVALRALSC